MNVSNLTLNGEAQLHLRCLPLGLTVCDFWFIINPNPKSYGIISSGRNAGSIKNDCFVKVMLMLFRPSFCANCGEKIERAEWGILTSRRFCQVCESEYKGHDLIPRAIVGLGVVVGLFGFGSYLKSGSVVSDTQALRPQQKLAEQTAPVTRSVEANASLQGNSNAVAGVTDGQNQFSGKTLISSQSSPALPKSKTEMDGQTYYCGAETKKGTPCSRRVKGNIRCFQHVGMPAMASAGKLRAN